MAAGCTLELEKRNACILSNLYLIYNNFKANEVYKNYNINNFEIFGEDNAHSNQFNAYLRVAKIGLLYNF